MLNQNSVQFIQLIFITLYRYQIIFYLDERLYTFQQGNNLGSEKKKISIKNSHLVDFF